MPQRVTVWAEAGGVGKTTIAMNVAAALAREGRDVLAVDLDPQRASLTDWAGFGDRKNSMEYTSITDCLVEEDRDLADIIVDAGEFDLVPGHSDLTQFEQRTAGDASPVFFLKSELDKVSEQYDHIIIDAPATRGRITDNALVATQNLLVPVVLGHKAFQTVQDIEESVGSLQRSLNRGPMDHQLTLLGVVPNKVDERVIQRESRTALEERGTLFVPVDIRKRSVLEDAWHAHMSIFEYAETHELADYETDLLEQFPKLAALIMGEWNPKEDDAAPVEA
jgi:chromosome partitioning protein